MSYQPENPKVAVEKTGGREIQVDIKSRATTKYLRWYIYYRSLGWVYAQTNSRVLFVHVLLSTWDRYKS